MKGVTGREWNDPLHIAWDTELTDEGKGKEGKGRERKGKEGRGREGKGGEGKGREGNGTIRYTLHGIPS